MQKVMKIKKIDGDFVVERKILLIGIYKRG
jgi:hypothetical protein